MLSAPILMKVLLYSCTVLFYHILYMIDIHLGSSVCRPICHPVVLSYSCHSCGTLSYSLCFSDQTDQGNETEGLKREGLKMELGKGQIGEGGCE
jgi:hypothetical protein